MVADTFVFAQAFCDHFGPERRFHQLAHDLLFKVPGTRALVQRYGTIPASRENMKRALDRDAALLVYPGGRPRDLSPLARFISSRGSSRVGSYSPTHRKAGPRLMLTILLQNERPVGMTRDAGTQCPQQRHQRLVAELVTGRSHAVLTSARSHDARALYDSEGSRLGAMLRRRPPVAGCSQPRSRSSSSSG